jgi:hypothetical protein
MITEILIGAMIILIILLFILAVRAGAKMLENLFED